VKEPIYLDQAATSFPKPLEVAEAVAEALTAYSASPGRSAHQYSLAASRSIFDAREATAELLGVPDSSRIVFCLNVTWALNTALGKLKPGGHVLTSCLEHNSVMRPLNHLARERRIEVEAVPLSPKGYIDPNEFSKRRRPDTQMAVVTHASNVTGLILPIREIRKALDGAPLLVDAAQTAGVVSLDPATDLADMIAFTGHKGLLGPTGTGGLWIRDGLDVPPLARGGTGSRSEREEQPEFMPDALEAGTPNTHGLAGLAAGIRYVLQTGPDKILDHERALTGAFLDGLNQIRGVTIYGPTGTQSRLGVVSLNLDGWSPSDLALALDRNHGIMTRSGLHCAPRAHQTLGTLPQGTVRFSFGHFNTREHIDKALEALDALSREN
jgi:cysteine desulfurase/selenocysteine lyase